MAITTLTSQVFNQYPSQAKKGLCVLTRIHYRSWSACAVVVDYCGIPEVTRSQTNIVEMLAMPGVADIDFTPTPVRQ